MRIIYANQKFPISYESSIFLAGPTPRSAEVLSWRPKALELLKQRFFSGDIYVPEDETGEWKHSYTDQIKWEEEGLEKASVIVFWVPRDLKTMPAFTTNIEWGYWCRSGKVVLGAPEDAPKMKYLRYYATKFGVPQAYTLAETIDAAIESL